VNNLPQEIPGIYEPDKIERKWYDFWLEQSYFTPKIDFNKKPFVIVMPPPNVTGELHLGHSLTITLEDIMARWHRMKGEPTLWVPGTDHAGIATQIVIERQLAKQKQTKEDIGREKFVELAWEWVHKSRKTINYQHQRLGVSCDWSREHFTLDEGPSKAVRTAFVNLYRKGLIYKGERMVNWCPHCQTALSDLEVEHKDTAGHLYHIRYFLEESDVFITVATTRPETLLGDVAVAVNPEDIRYKHFIGKNVVLPIIRKKIPVVADNAVDVSFGTGALKITPAHDPTDFEIAHRHRLPSVNIMDTAGTMNENAGPFQGQERFVCRDNVIAELKNLDLLHKIEPYLHSVGYCSRCQTAIEPKISLQWFIKTQPLAVKAVKAVKEKRVTILPERFTKTYFDWMENIKDWCISRQIWWGHRIPVWYCQKCDNLTVSVDEPSECTYCNSKEIFQDTDVLDTWFSSALWPHSTLGWPADTADLRYFYPTSVMETGYDILFFWVARMIMLGLENTGDIPFRTVYLNGLIRDEKGEKMSKLKGNVINPLKAIDEYGTDALRFAITTGSSPGNDINLGEQKLEAGRNFTNKIWNASRFIFRNIQSATENGEYGQLDLISSFAGLNDSPCLQAERLEDRWIISQLNRLVRDVNRALENYQFGEAEQQIHDFFWSAFCDWYIEFAKVRLRNHSKPSPLPFLIDVLEKVLRLLHPFMPFITEEIWQTLKQISQNKNLPDSIMVASYPDTDVLHTDKEAERVLATTTEIIRSIRNVRAQYKIKPTQKIECTLYTDEKFLPSLSSQTPFIEVLARTRLLNIKPRSEREAEDEEALKLVLTETEVLLHWTSIENQAEERQRLCRERETIQTRAIQIEKRLGDTSFLSNAPPDVVERERTRLQTLEDKRDRLEKEIALLN